MNYNIPQIVKRFTIGVMVLNLALIVNFMLFPIVSPDAGFYLSVAREFYQGKIFFVEIGSIYNPLAIVTVGLPFLFDQNPDVRYHIAVNLAIIVFTAYFFYQVLKKIAPQTHWNLLLANIFLLLMLFNDGRYVILEPLSVMFQLLALLFYLNFEKSKLFLHLFFSGLWISLAFLSKQYGLFIAIPVGIALLQNAEPKIKQILSIGIGFLIPLVLLFLFIQTSSFSILDFVTSILGKGVHLDKGNGTGMELDIQSKMMFVLIFLATNLYVILIPLNVLKVKKNPHYRMFLIALLSSFMVLFFAFYQHYFIYIIPYFLLVFGLQSAAIQTTSFQYKTLILLLISTGLILYSVTASFNRKKEVYFAQVRYTKELNKVVPPQSNVYLDGVSPSYFYLAQYNSIHSKNVGYCFPGYLFASTIVANMKKGDYLITSKQNYASYSELISGFTTSKQVIENEELYIIKK